MLAEHASDGIVETLSSIELGENGPARTADEQAESLRAALAVHVEVRARSRASGHAPPSR
jgi:transketolase